MSVPEFHAATHHPEIATLRDLVATGAWAEVVATFAEWRREDAGAMTLAAEALYGGLGLPDLLRQHADEPLARSLQALVLIRQAWEARTRQPAADVTPEQWEAFRARLVTAEQTLVELAALDPSEPLVASLRLLTARGLGLGLSECERRYERVRSVAPDAVDAQSWHLQSLAPKWYGSNDLMLGFVEDTMARSTPGSHAGRLVAEAQIERWLELDGDEGVLYLAAGEQRDSLLRAEEHSVFHDAYDDGLQWVADHSAFALAHSLAGRPADAAPHFEVLGDYATDSVWRYVNDPGAWFVEFRNRALVANGASA